ncbi:MAG: hypothetical protein VX498_08040 [Myxococcota bacterium]|nr:hypothetical protein [Myxococcota bacterium]
MREIVLSRPAALASWMFLLALLGAPPQSSAHDGILFGLQPFVQEDELLGGSTSWGLVLREGEELLWTCSETTGSNVFWRHLGTDGLLLAGTGDGIRISEDGGCSWSAVPDFPGELANYSVAPHPTDPLRLVSVTGGSEQTNHLLESLDGGRTWTSLRSVAGASFWRAVWGRAGDDLLLEQVSDAGVPVLHFSAEGGRSWLVEDFPLEGWNSVGLFGPSLSGVDLWFTGLSPSGEFTLARLPFSLDGEVVVERSFPKILTAFVERPEGLHIVLSFMTYILWVPGEEDYVEQDPGVSACLRDFDGVLWGCGGEPNHAQFSRSDDGTSWEGILFLDDVVPRSCPSDSPAAELCPQAWELVQEALLMPPVPGDDDDDDDSSEDAAGCEDCSSGNGGAQAALLLCALPGLLRRRRLLRSRRR